MSRRLKAVTLEAVRLHCLLQRIQPSVSFWQLSFTQEKHNAQSAGPWRYISCSFSTAGTLSQSEKTLPDSPSAPKTKSQLPCPKLLEELRHTAVKHFGKLNIDPSALESVVESILQLGFSQIQVKQLLALNPSIALQPPQKNLPALFMLNVLGLNPSSTIKILQKCPELFGGSLQRVLVHCPQILNLSAKRVNNTVRFFKDKCIFTGQQITEILQTSPNVLFEKLEELEYKFQYAYFRMGIKQSEITKSGLFRVSLEELKQRHIFLERLGLYQTPDKKGQTQIVNPKPKNILTTSEEYFLTKVAMSSWGEFEVFKKLLSREEVEKELEYSEWEGNKECEEESSSEEDEGPF